MYTPQRNRRKECRRRTKRGIDYQALRPNRSFTLREPKTQAKLEGWDTITGVFRVLWEKRKKKNSSGDSHKPNPLHGFPSCGRGAPLAGPFQGLAQIKAKALARATRKVVETKRSIPPPLRKSVANWRKTPNRRNPQSTKKERKGGALVGEWKKTHREEEKRGGKPSGDLKGEPHRQGLGSTIKNADELEKYLRGAG